MASTSVFKARFWGVRGTVPCPGASTIRYGGNTACVEILCGKNRLIFDAGTGERELGKEIGKEESGLSSHIFFSHTHLDHVSGLPFFYPAYVKGNCFEFWGGHLNGSGTNLKTVLKTLLQPPLFPVPLHILSACAAFYDFEAGQGLHPIDGINIRTIPLSHPGGATGYRVDYDNHSICYITDVEIKTQRDRAELVDFVRDSQMMIFDTTYTDEEYTRFEGWGHSTWQDGVRLSDEANVEQLVCFHHDPSRDDEALDLLSEEISKQRPGTIVAREGMVLEP